MLGLAAWQRDDVHDAMRWLGDIALFEAPSAQVLDRLTLSAGSRRPPVMPACAHVSWRPWLLERERPRPIVHRGGRVRPRDTPT